MAYPSTTQSSRHATVRPPSPVQAVEWRCHDCGKLLGVHHGPRLHIRLQRHNYFVSLPAEAVCPGCGAENRT